MSILIKGMEMPKDGEKLYMIVFSDGKACASYKPFEWHEVVPVPPHGRLVDADALIDAHEQVCSRSMKFNLDLAPTIIPADEGEA